MSIRMIKDGRSAEIADDQVKIWEKNGWTVDGKVESEETAVPAPKEEAQKEEPKKEPKAEKPKKGKGKKGK